jgi:hypothetical protein
LALDRASIDDPQYPAAIHPINGAHNFIPLHYGNEPIHGARSEAGVGFAQNATNVCNGAKDSILIIGRC